VAHAAHLRVQEQLAAGELVAELPALTGATYVGIGQSLGGFITIIQQGKYADYPAIGIFGASPLLIEGIRDQPDWDSMSPSERREWIIEANAATSGVEELPMYSGAPRENFRGIFHVPDVPDDLFRYDAEECSTLIPRYSGVDGMTPGLAQPWADRIDVPVFLAFGEIDVSGDPRREPSAYPSSPDITTVVVPHMAHMHNFADTRVQLWERFLTWLPVARSIGST
jgi:pimeloyl-ACP methyl ester carboxylesterase